MNLKGLGGIAPWILGSVVAFLLTAAAFLLLANLGTEPSEVRLDPRQAQPRSNTPLELSLDEELLSSLTPNPDQPLTLDVANGGEEPLSDVNLNVEVYSEDTASPEGEVYRKTVPEIPVGESAEVPFDLDLSPSGAARSYPGPDPPRRVIEIRATTPDGTSAIRTAIVQL